MTVRPAVASDRVRILELMRSAHSGAEFDRVDGFTGFRCPWSQPHMERCLTRHMNGSDAVALVLATLDGLGGILLAVAFEHPFGPVRLAKDTVWFIEPHARSLRNALAMLRAFEEWAASLNVDQAGICGMGRDPRVGKLLERCGYTIADTHWIKRAQ